MQVIENIKLWIYIVALKETSLRELESISNV